MSTLEELKLDIKRTGFPVHIAGIEFWMDASVEKLADYAEAFRKIDENNEEVTLEDTNGLLHSTRSNYDTLLGAGAFDKIYEQVPDVWALNENFLPLIAGIEHRIYSYVEKQQKETQDIVKRYNNKKKKMKKT